MTIQTFKVIDPSGMHARPASQLVQKAMLCKEDVIIQYGDKSANAKSIMSIMALGITNDETFTLKISGADSEELMNQFHRCLSENGIVLPK